ncbi:hypothetical protein CONCODRAFT_9149 [Conidiobolus coronatus NRRL 28638]|uniref:Uncharacterized protein n=1 Tax=Conidiobolus coronatus (strain ATCC 28846 / CBS 209.66 / NRRL 28638) TaxID=796925 RepID=A0A137P0I4_CONC2|nr:hypothetical protein CONCODRAFT_9149 [Conidiobolus coronatus NRRL 28638]|eukprot:KXN68556.1 hypothetical protein CONCODRAFT_9149 [Conidiobolus coronatus NRRL 28638]
MVYNGQLRHWWVEILRRSSYYRNFQEVMSFSREKSVPRPYKSFHTLDVSLDSACRVMVNSNSLYDWKIYYDSSAWAGIEPENGLDSINKKNNPTRPSMAAQGLLQCPITNEYKEVEKIVLLPVRNVLENQRYMIKVDPRLVRGLKGDYCISQLTSSKSNRHMKIDLIFF